MLSLTDLKKSFRRASIGLAAVSVLGGAGLASAQSGEVAQEEVQALDLRAGDAADTCDTSVPQIRVTVNGIEGYGILLVEVYGDNARHFLSSEGRLRRVRVAAEDGPQTVCIGVDGAGTYAVASYHDQDGDRQLDKKWNRLPKEPFALSNDPKLKLRKPRLSEAAFVAGELGADIEITLRDG